MKKKIMKNYMQLCGILFVCAAMLLTSCQVEGTEIENPPLEDSIVPESELATLIQRAATEDRSFDDFIDLADCLSINLPFTIIVNEVSITISNENDYVEVIALLEKLNNNYNLEIVYPIVITLNDYTQIVINSEEELTPYVEDCVNQEENIPCIEFVFPISFSIYNIEFELIGTVIINSNEELYLFIENIQEGTLVSLNFPVSMALQDGDIIIEVNNNTELQEALEDADLNCNMDGQIDFSCFDAINDVLVTCVNASNETAYFNLFDAVSECNQNELFQISFHYTEEEALSNQNPIPNANEFALASPFLDNMIHIRVTSGVNPEEFRMYSNLLIVENCNDEICNIDELIVFLNECSWVTDGNTSFILEFNNGEVTASINGFAQTGKYTSDVFIIESSGHYFTQFTLSGFSGDFAVLNTVYEVGFCNEEQIQVHTLDPDIPLPFSILERDCAIGCDNPGFLTDDLIIYIPFGEEAVDLVSGEELDDGAITYTEDRAGNPSCAASFTGNGIIPITVTDQNDLTSQDAFSVSIWFRMANEEGGDLETFFQKVNTTNEGFSIGVYDLNTPLCFAYDPPFSIWDTDWNEQVDVAWTNTDWHHLVIIKTQANVVQLWRDGILRNTQDGLDIGLETLSYNLGNNLVGNLDDLRVYKRTLNENEISQLYNLEADCFTCL